MFRIEAEMLSDVGRRRPRNEDAIDQRLPATDEAASVLGPIFVLADGIGGSVAGEIASREAVSEVIRAYYDETLSPLLGDVIEDVRVRLRNAVRAANSRVYSMAEHNPDMQRMATTLVMAAIRDDLFAIAHVGDSPAFLVRDGQIRKLTTDHNFAEMQVRAGYLTKDEAWTHPDRHKLVRAVGRLTTIEVDIVSDVLRPGDYLLLCSDGLTRYVMPIEMMAVLKSQSLAEAVPALVERANERGGSDNISLIAIHALPEDGSELEISTASLPKGKRKMLIRRFRLRRLRAFLLGFTAVFTAIISFVSMKVSNRRAG
ncbi:MAG: serine/threonine-protein phosphatase [Chloroflexi bacterium]|nr:serine/threonine-protein phosphatase [Chloroflexota bacterium]